MDTSHYYDWFHTCEIAVIKVTNGDSVDWWIDDSLSRLKDMGSAHWKMSQTRGGSVERRIL